MTELFLMALPVSIGMALVATALILAIFAMNEREDDDR